MSNSAHDRIIKSLGVTDTERLLVDLCDRTFLKLWSYPNPYNDDRKELCDLIAVFGNHVFLFFDRESRKFERDDGDVCTTWQRWKREAIDRQIRTARGAARYIISGRDVYLDSKMRVPLPLSISPTPTIYKLIIAHGAREACERFSSDNIYGSLAIFYGAPPKLPSFPFLVHLDKEEPVHVFDSHNIHILFRELDTFYDFMSYIHEKERAIATYDALAYTGEEDLLAHYFRNYDIKNKRYTIGVGDHGANALMIGEGEWKSFVESKEYSRRKTANANSYLWDDIIQRTSQNALDGTLQGDSTFLDYENAIREMAKEPRVSRRALSDHMIKAIQTFPETPNPFMRKVSFIPSFYKGTGYVFLQIKCDNKGDYEKVYRPRRRTMLEIACGAARNKMPHLKKIIGIAIDAPKYAESDAEDFIFMDCAEWPRDLEKHYQTANKDFRFFETPGLTKTELRIKEFPTEDKPQKRKIGRNERCVCGSGRKYKHCCLKRGG